MPAKLVLGVKAGMVLNSIQNVLAYRAGNTTSVGLGYQNRAGSTASSLSTVLRPASRRPVALC